METTVSRGLKRSLRGVKRLSPREAEISRRRFVDFSSNDYMALSMREELAEGASSWIRRYGSGSAASRLISGTSDACLELESEIAEWKGFESALVMSSGYAANVGVVDALARRDGAVYADKLNHASLNQGCILSGSAFRRYRHLDFEQLETMIAKDAFSEPLIVSDTVFSMDGDTADLEKIHSIAEKNRCILYLDDAHGTGVFGERGKGRTSPELCDISLSTFSKAMGCYGACIACSAEFREFFINTCSPFIFSTALPPAVLGAISAAVKLIQTEEMDKARAALLGRSEFVRKSLSEMGFNTGTSSTMIIPIIIGDAHETLAFSAKLYEKGILALAVRPPTVPMGTSRIRLSLNAAHTEADIEQLLSAVKYVATN